MSGALHRWLRRIHLVPAEAAVPRPLPISVQPELGYLAQVENIAKLDAGALPAEGAWSRLIDARHIEEADLMPLLAGKTAGKGAPDWHAGNGGAPMFGAHVCRVASVYYAPEYGALIMDNGVVLYTSVAEALYLTPTLTALPGASSTDDGVTLTLPKAVPDLAAATIFVPWGGRFNYGHFLLDALPALAAIREFGLLETHPPIAPMLTPWQRELLQLYLGADSPPTVESDAPFLKIGDAVFASPMDHFLHAPNRLMIEVRQAILGNVARGPTGVSRLYLSRRGDEKRRLLNEASLEEALTARGFTVVHPADYSVIEQIALFRDAQVIVAPTGAALANAIFCAPGAKVFEIQPTNFVGIWVRGLCHLFGVDWHGFFAPSPTRETEVRLEDAPRPGVLFEWELKLDEFLKFLDVSLGSAR